MKNIKLFDRRLGFSLGAASILFGSLAPAVVPAFASAMTEVSDRSIAMSNSAGGATGVDYKMIFTPSAGDGTSVSMAVEFCDNSPLVTTTCSKSAGLAGMDVSGATVGGDSATLDADDPAGSNFVVFQATVTDSSPNTITLGNITNPTADNTPFYARIMIFTSKTNADTIDGSGTSGHEDEGAITDSGAVALSTGSEIGVTADVLEHLQFCVFGDPTNSHTATTDGTGANDPSYVNGDGDTVTGVTTGDAGPTASCGPTAVSGSTSTAITLGQTIATGVVALQTGTPSYAAGWTQLDTNAQGGATVFLRNSNDCKGLKSASDGAGVCGIPAASGAIAAGTAGFGLSFGSVNATNGAFAPSDGALESDATPAIHVDTDYAPADSSAGGNYALTTDSTDPYGVAAYDSNSKPVDGANVPFDMGVAIANNTPAGEYKANLDLIAVGTF